MPEFSRNTYNTNKALISNSNQSYGTAKNLGRKSQEEISQDMLRNSANLNTMQRELIKRKEQEAEAKNQAFSESIATYSKKTPNIGNNNTATQRDIMRGLNKPKF